MTIREILEDIKSERKKKVILDTDAFNEIDDQYAIGYCYLCDKIDLIAAVAAPFHHDHKESMEEGMLKSYNEIVKVLNLCCEDHNVPVYKGSAATVSETGSYVESEGADAIIDAVRSSDEIVYVLAIGAITNVASAIMKAPDIKDNMCVIWVAINDISIPDSPVEYNLEMDYAAGQEFLSSGVPIVICPARYITSKLRVSIGDVRELRGANPVCDYLWKITEDRFNMVGGPELWRRTLWDLGAPAIIDLPERLRFSIMKAPILTDDSRLIFDESPNEIITVDDIDRDAVIEKAWFLLKGANNK